MQTLKYLTISFILFMLVVAADRPIPLAIASPDAVAPPLGAATSFAVLGASTVTSTGNTEVTGDLGVSPGPSIGGFPPGTVSGGTYENVEPAVQAHSDAADAYNALTLQTCDVDLTGLDLGTMTLAPGVYCFDTSAQLTGTLVLDAGGDPNAVWVFQIGSTLTTASNSSVTMLNGGLECKVFWQVGTSATLGTNTAFAGNILADQSITLTTDTDVIGRALAINAAVTMDTNDVSNAACFGPTAFVIRDFQANSVDGSPFGQSAGAALLLAMGLIVFGWARSSQRLML